MFSAILLLFIKFFPWCIQRFILNEILGHSVAKTAKIGWSLIIVTKLEMSEGSSIGSFCVFRRIPSVHLGENSSIGSWNWFTSIALDSGEFRSSPSRNPRFYMGREAAFTSRHYVDVQDEIVIGDFATIAGVRSCIFTHGIDVIENVQRAKPVVIGAYSYIGSNTLILAGANIPDKSVVAAGAVFNKSETQSGLYAGIPAVYKRGVCSSAHYFNRTKGAVL